MRPALLALALAACSSPAPTSTTTMPPSDVPDPIEDEPADPPPDEPVAKQPPVEPEPAGPCLGPDFTPIQVADDAVVLCSGSGCVTAHEDGSFEDVERPAPAHPATIMEDGTVKACPNGTCKTLKPKVGDDLIASVAMDFAGARLALVIPRGPRVELQVWDVAKGKQLAVTTVEDVSGDLAVGFLGDAVLMIVDHGSDEPVVGTLWGVKSGKLVLRTTLDGDLRFWAPIDARRGAIVLDEDVHVIDPATGEPTLTIDWRAPLDKNARDFDGDPDLRIAATGKSLAVLVHDTGDDSLHLEVFPIDGGAAETFALRGCR